MKDEKKGTEVVKATDTSVAMTDMERDIYMNKVDGGQTLDAGDMTIPRVSLIQGLSAAATRPENQIKTGNWYNELTGEDYGKSIRVIVLDVIAGYMLYGDKEGKKNQIIAQRWKSSKVRSFDPDLITDAMLSNRVFKKGEKSNIADAYCYQVIVNEKDLALITLKASACKAARKLNTLLQTKTEIINGKTIKMPFYAFVYNIGSTWIDKGDKKYWEPSITPAGKPNATILQAAHEMARDLNGKVVRVDIEDHADEGLGDAKKNGEVPF